jgi:hypothetical protein
MVVKGPTLSWWYPHKPWACGVTGLQIAGRVDGRVLTVRALLRLSELSCCRVDYFLLLADRLRELWAQPRDKTVRAADIHIVYACPGLIVPNGGDSDE